MVVIAIRRDPFSGCPAPQQTLRFEMVNYPAIAGARDFCWKHPNGRLRKNTDGAKSCGFVARKRI